MGSNKIPWILFEFEKKPRGFFSRQLGLGFYGGNNSFPQQLNICEPIISISCGAGHTICVTVKNKIYVWGSNRYYQLGLGDTTNQYSPQQLKF